MYAKETVCSLKSSKSIVIYGAGKIAQTVYYCLVREPYNLRIDCFLVSDLNNNPRKIEEIPVVIAKEWKNRDSLVLIAVMDGFLEDIQNHLKELAYTNVLCLTFESDLWADLRGNYFEAVYKNMDMQFLRLEEETEQCPTGLFDDTKVSIFIVLSAMDRKTVMDRTVAPWEKKIFAGAALSEENISGICDNIGENISKKNRIYCELTALYWIWKNDSSEYVGLSHYRRRFELDEEKVKVLYASNIDVVLTIPVLNFPNVHDIYVTNHFEEDWNIMMEAIQTLYPQYYETAKKLQDGNFYYGYNMLIAKRDVLSAYCEWLFDILAYCEERCESKPRYIGYLAERLLGIYFLRNWKKYKIVHARRHFILRELQ